MRANNGVKFGEAVRGGAAPAVHMDGDFSPAATVAVTTEVKKAPAVSVPALTKSTAGKSNGKTPNGVVAAALLGVVLGVVVFALCGLSFLGLVAGIGAGWIFFAAAATRL